MRQTYTPLKTIPNSLVPKVLMEHIRKIPHHGIEEKHLNAVLREVRPKYTGNPKQSIREDYVKEDLKKITEKLIEEHGVPITKNKQSLFKQKVLKELKMQAEEFKEKNKVKTKQFGLSKDIANMIMGDTKKKSLPKYPRYKSAPDVFEDVRSNAKPRAGGAADTSGKTPVGTQGPRISGGGTKIGEDISLNKQKLEEQEKLAARKPSHTLEDPLLKEGNVNEPPDMDIG